MTFKRIIWSCNLRFACFPMVRSHLLLRFCCLVISPNLGAALPIFRKGLEKYETCLSLLYSSSQVQRGPVRSWVCSSSNTCIFHSQTYCISINAAVFLIWSPTEHAMLVLKIAYYYSCSMLINTPVWCVPHAFDMLYTHVNSISHGELF